MSLLFCSLLFFGEFNVDNTWHVNKTQTLSTGGADYTSHVQIRKKFTLLTKIQYFSMLAWFVEDANIFHEQCFT
ncbi:hypothetical protein T265_01974 [Opisthorchis viverrini]|uniref:Uncharacterized protein n=1 Tax=Opisthorchis viverrini TaxID=6198 RepID=A0A075AIM4_OPIVI|nr:hypothetical protein T265_01974 [Opisthorchis viverrini]KER31889.1 hypothetical protein T265_01974 [Opisthorchis viverrini]